MLKAREGIRYSLGEDHNIESLKATFDDYCPQQQIPYEENPFFTCVERAGLYTDVSSVTIIICLQINSSNLSLNSQM